MDFEHGRPDRPDYRCRWLYRTIRIMYRVLISLFAVGLLVVPIVALTYITSIAYTLITLALFASAVGCVVAVFTRSKYQDIFSITAGYAAVLVIFVGNLLAKRSG